MKFEQTNNNEGKVNNAVSQDGDVRQDVGSLRIDQLIIEGAFWLNEQDPYEPTGIMFQEPGKEIACLDEVLSLLFGIPAGESDGKSRGKLRMTIERVE